MKGFARSLYQAALLRMTPQQSLTIQYLLRTRSLPNLRSPQTFNEKVLSRKLHENNAEFTRLADKIRVKDHVRAVLGDQYVIPTVWSGTALPSDRSGFPKSVVIKSNHMSGDVVFVEDVATADWERIGHQTDQWLLQAWRPYVHERWYHRITPRLLVEPFLGRGGSPPSDYKMFVFDGVVRLIQVDVDRFTCHRRALFDPKWNRLPVTFAYPPIKKDVPPPLHLDAMLAAAAKIGADFPFVRADFYDMPEGPKFGELTFAPEGGVGRFVPSSFDAELGHYWTGTTT